jgi:hypothetical protein
MAVGADDGEPALPERPNPFAALQALKTGSGDNGKD